MDKLGIFLESRCWDRETHICVSADDFNEAVQLITDCLLLTAKAIIKLKYKHSYFLVQRKIQDAVLICQYHPVHSNFFQDYFYRCFSYSWVNRLWKFFSLGKPEQGFNFCWKQNKSGWNLASYSHCCHISFLIHISSNLKILVKVSRAWMGKAALHIQPHGTGLGSLEALVAAIWWTWPHTWDLGGSRGRWPHGWGQHALLSIRCIVWGIVFTAWFKTCILHGLTFFQRHRFRLVLDKRTSEGKSCTLSSRLKASDNVPCSECQEPCLML